MGFLTADNENESNNKRKLEYDDGELDGEKRIWRLFGIKGEWIYVHNWYNK